MFTEQNTKKKSPLKLNDINISMFEKFKQQKLSPVDTTPNSPNEKEKPKEDFDDISNIHLRSAMKEGIYLHKMLQKMGLIRSLLVGKKELTPVIADLNNDIKILDLNYLNQHKYLNASKLLKANLKSKKNLFNNIDAIIAKANDLYNGTKGFVSISLTVTMCLRSLNKHLKAFLDEVINTKNNVSSTVNQALEAERKIIIDILNSNIRDQFLKLSDIFMGCKNYGLCKIIPDTLATLRPKTPPQNQVQTVEVVSTSGWRCCPSWFSKRKTPNQSQPVQTQPNINTPNQQRQNLIQAYQAIQSYVNKTLEKINEVKVGDITKYLEKDSSLIDTITRSKLRTIQPNDIYKSFNFSLHMLNLIGGYLAIITQLSLLLEAHQRSVEQSSSEIPKFPFDIKGYLDHIEKVRIKFVDIQTQLLKLKPYMLGHWSYRINQISQSPEKIATLPTPQIFHLIANQDFAIMRLDPARNHKHKSHERESNNHAHPTSM